MPYLPFRNTSLKHTEAFVQHPSVACPDIRAVSSDALKAAASLVLAKVQVVSRLREQAITVCAPKHVMNATGRSPLGASQSERWNRSTPCKASGLTRVAGF